MPSISVSSAKASSGRSENVSTLIPHARKASATSGMLTCERTAPRYA